MRVNVQRGMYFLVKGFLTLLLVLLTAEGLLRVQERYRMSPELVAQREYSETVGRRVYSAWLSTKGQSSPFAPPFLVYADTGIDDSVRMRQIFETTRLPPSRTWTAPGFLQSKQRASTTSYTVHSNSLGFRGPERTKKKPPGVYRIIVLGSYDAFGHGVEDDQTYEARLESDLNATLPGKYEVWNGGRHAGTAIVGLARMQYEIFQYQPDLIILDYGTVDKDVFGDNFFPKAMRFPDSGPFLLFRRVLSPMVPILGHSLLWDAVKHKFFSGGDYSAARQQQFERTIQAMVSLAQAHSVPVVIVKETYMTYQTVAEKNSVHFLDVESLFKAHPPAYPPVSQWQKGFWASTWLAELSKSPLLVRAITESSSSSPKLHPYYYKQYQYYPYYRSLLRLNAKGMQVVGDGLAELIKKEIVKRRQ